MSGVHDDLATLRRSVRFSNAQPSLSLAWECYAALDRVEAEIARLRENLAYAEETVRTGGLLREQTEARCARLQQALQQYADLRHWRVENDGMRYPLTIWIGPGATHAGQGGTKIAREALAGLDTPADSQPEDGTT